MTYRLAIIEFHEALNNTGIEFSLGDRRFKLVETYQTSDGMRSRLCDGHWPSKEEAKKEMKRRIDAIKG